MLLAAVCMLASCNLLDKLTGNDDDDDDGEWVDPNPDKVDGTVSVNGREYGVTEAAHCYLYGEENGVYLHTVSISFGEDNNGLRVHLHSESADAEGAYTVATDTSDISAGTVFRGSSVTYFGSVDEKDPFRTVESGRFTITRTGEDEYTMDFSFADSVGDAIEGAYSGTVHMYCNTSEPRGSYTTDGFSLKLYAMDITENYPEGGITMFGMNVATESFYGVNFHINIYTDGSELDGEYTPNTADEPAAGTFDGLGLESGKLTISSNNGSCALIVEGKDYDNADFDLSYSGPANYVFMGATGEGSVTFENREFRMDRAVLENRYTGQREFNVSMYGRQWNAEVYLLMTLCSDNGLGDGTFTRKRPYDEFADGLFEGTINIVRWDEENDWTSQEYYFGEGSKIKVSAIDDKYKFEFTCWLDDKEFTGTYEGDIYEGPIL